ncbi:MAG: Inositol monophosphatase [Microgenomates group bacterium GW2011_GWC1_46_16]|uniref:Uncharacterized protein n=1 Tax=Candidatus Collierbacteria bacterium RIFOXYA2_FULL_46_10 TaxID=1817726 RepID=A0A1F5F735_9BACT|nr:MAG: Inositol monophosphatase [Microgenomates group bacterium GW2011_GWF1_46_12]KKU26511.1 MAG: Inositol monophosphatase [Microgenomates group bacterium GW2011_GWC1_46_16]KKU27725.1 MAG: Inositol monophosphatase [Microgenomates group bacterium GW2011_GWF2_46_18]KKU43026.1 MAG: Inositol monophosphatase [Microgenomates group bacterium GW2011_GWA1_46_7]KKU45147.1 MAG: Inositol monophosphatase [Microgenomates group bacterium GW2011_GWB1_46_7]KKU61601.1 MAG: Inositol monophosphatase [Microgenoma
MKVQFVPHLKRMFEIAQEAIKGPALVEETGEVNVKGDRSIGMDVRIEELLIGYIKRNNLPVTIFSEEQGLINFHSNPEFMVAFDPLDGSTNYKIGKGLLPFGLLVAFYEGVNPKLKNVIASGAIEYTRDLAWFFDGERTMDQNGKAVILNSNWPIQQSTPVYLDLYYKDGYNFYAPLAQQIFVRNTGSTIGNLSYVLSNVAAGMGGVCMRAEEIGAVYSLIKGAKGLVLDHEGKDLGEVDFNPDTTYPILAGSKNIVEFCLSKITE